MQANSPLIAVCGAPASGKTTLASDLMHTCSAGTRLVPDLPREALTALGWGIAEADPRGFQNYVGIRQLLEENLASATADGAVICDKSLADAVAYWDVLVGEARPPWASALTAGRYARVIVCDPGDVRFEQVDAQQKRHWEFRARIQSALLAVLREHNVPYQPVSGTRTGRMTSDPTLIELISHLSQKPGTRDGR